MKAENNIEELFKNSFNGFEADPGANAWGNIQSQINVPVTPNAASNSVNSSFWVASGTKILTAVIAASIIGLGIGGYFYFDNKGAKKKEERLPIEQNEKLNTPLITHEKSNSEEKELISNLKLEEPSTSQEIKEESVQINSNTNQKQVESQKSTIANSSTISDHASESINPIESENIADQIITDHVLENPTNSAEPGQKNETQAVANIIDVETSNSESKQIIDDSTIPENNLEKATSTVEELVLDLPNIFTPNQDGVNDVFRIEDEEIKNLRVIILNKSGIQIHEWTGNYGFWDGKLPNGSNAPNDVYLYKLTGEKNSVEVFKQSTIILKR